MNNNNKINKKKFFNKILLKIKKKRNKKSISININKNKFFKPHEINEFGLEDYDSDLEL